MEEHQKLIVVPWDFTPVAEHALAHAVKISRMVGNEICLLHIVDKGLIPTAEGQKRCCCSMQLKRTVKSTICQSSHILSKEAYSSQLLSLQMTKDARSSLVYGHPWYERDAEADRKLGPEGDC